MRALVTGHCGFLGSHFMDALRLRGWHTYGWDTRDSLFPIDCRELFRLSREHFDLVVHCAALVDGRETIENKAALLGAYNVQLDGALFEWALRNRPGRIVYVSSSAAYAVVLQDGVPLPLNESDAFYVIDPDATYGWTKLTGERVAQEVRKAGVPVTIIRPFSGYGEDQTDRYPFPAIIRRAQEHQDPFVVWGDGTQVRDFIHVDDIVSATLALVKNRVDGPVNLGTGIGTSMDELAGLAMKTAGYEAPIHHMTDKPQGVRYRVADTTLLRNYYEPKVTLEEGVRRALGAR